MAPSVFLIGALSLSNGLRFDSYGLTPMLPYHLSSRTSPYVEELPRSYEPGRSVLIAGRDRALLRGESMAPANYIWDTRDELERVTGLTGPDLDRYLLRVQLRLIADNPFGYLDAVRAALSNLTTMDSQPVVLGQGRTVVWAEQLVHLGLSVLFLAAMAVMPGLALARRLSRRSLRFLGIGSLLVGYTVVVSAMVETGTARLRAPVEPILVGLFVVAVSAARAEWAARVARVEDSTHGR